LPSVGLHTNGYSLARKLLFEVGGYSPDTFVAELGCTAGEELLKAHRSYLGALDGLLESSALKGLAHITGGGLLENLPRILPEGTAASIRRDSWPVLPVFKLLARLGTVPDNEMYRTFNMGIGMVLVVSPSVAERVRAHLEREGERYYDIGTVIEGDRSVSILTDQ
jgi:phosphoribosylformylglycinamidine cyclo-ligase